MIGTGLCLDPPSASGSIGKVRGIQNKATVAKGDRRFGKTLVLPTANKNDLAAASGVQGVDVGTMVDVIRGIHGVKPLEELPLNKDFYLGRMEGLYVEISDSLQPRLLAIETAIFPGAGRLDVPQQVRCLTIDRAAALEDKVRQTLPKLQTGREDGPALCMLGWMVQMGPGLRLAVEGALEFFKNNWPKEVPFTLHPCALAVSHDVLVIVDEFGHGQYQPHLDASAFLSILLALTGWRRKAQVKNDGCFGKRPD